MVKSKITTWLARARTIARDQGPGALPQAIIRGLYARLYNIWTRDHYWQGRLVELLGNRWRLDGVVIHLDNPAIATRHKALLLNGAYELPERRLLQRHFKGDLPLIELGGCVGAISCIANRRLDDPDRHIVLEANPKLIPTLHRNRDRNSCRFIVQNAAVAYSPSGTVSFQEQAFTSGSVDPGGTLTVPSFSLEAVASKAGICQFDLICDIEGGEEELFRHEGEFLQNHVRWILIEFHPTLLGEARVERLSQIADELGFEILGVDRTVYCFRNRRLACHEH